MKLASPLATAADVDPRELAGAFAGFKRWATLSAALKAGRPDPDALFNVLTELLDLRHVPLGVERRCSAQALLRSVQAALVHQRHAPIEVPTAVEREPKEPAASAPQT